MNFGDCLVLILSLVLSGNVVNIPKPHMLMYVCVWYDEFHSQSLLTVGAKPLGSASHGCKNLNFVNTALLTMGAMAGLHFHVRKLRQKAMR